MMAVDMTGQRMVSSITVEAVDQRPILRPAPTHPVNPTI